MPRSVPHGSPVRRSPSRHVLPAISMAWVGVLMAAGSLPRQADPVAALAEALTETAQLPSLSVAILKDGEIEYARAWGFADVENGVAATVDTRYRCGSVSKVITATALAILVQEGRLELDSPITRYVPSWPAEPVITARQLSGHLAGVGHYQGEDRINRARHYASMEESVDVFRNSPRAGPPGKQYQYSTHGFTLLSAAIEGASGTPFLDVLEDEVYGPLGMTSSGPDMRARPHPNMSALYNLSEGRARIISEPEDPSYKWAGGGLTSTPSDLVRLGWGYLNGVLPPGLVEEMWTSQRTESGEETGVGIAWRIERDDAGRRVIHHSGGMGGARTTIAIFPDRREVIAVMTNAFWPSDIHTTAKLLIEAWRQGDGSDAGGRSAIETPTVFDVTGMFGEESADASFYLADGAGWITTPAPLRSMFEGATGVATERMVIRHLTGSTYALVTPLGILPIEIERRDGRVRGSGRVFRAVWNFEGR